MFEVLEILNALIWLWIVAGWLAVAIYMATVASAKGYRFGWWLIDGHAFSLMALNAAAGVSDASEDDG